MRQLVYTTEIRTVRINGTTYEFTRNHESEWTTPRNHYPAFTQLIARKWTGYRWETVHNFFLF